MIEASTPSKWTKNSYKVYKTKYKYQGILTAGLVREGAAPETKRQVVAVVG